jgi:aldose 1-epimerase
MTSIEQEHFGNTRDGQAIELYTLTNGNGLRARIMTYGATLVSLAVPDRSGAVSDIVLGFDEFAPYAGSHPYFGCVVGRYANRIAGASFNLGGKTYRLSANDGRHHLHGGRAGFDKRVWSAEARHLPAAAELVLSYASADGEEGYPGNLRANVTYSLTANNELAIEYGATTDEETLINLTNHSYFNLGGVATVEDHLLRLAAARYLPVDRELIPLGEQRPVAGTAFDFTEWRSIGAGLRARDSQVQLAGGYDHCWVLDAPGSSAAAQLYDPGSGRLMTLYTTQPGVQIYTGNFFDGAIRGKGAQAYGRYAGVCLETEHFPDAPNRPQFPPTVLRPGERYHQRTVMRFDTETT